jgi:hypothetical protein
MCGANGSFAIHLRTPRRARSLPAIASAHRVDPTIATAWITGRVDALGIIGARQSLAQLRKVSAGVRSPP